MRPALALLEVHSEVAELRRTVRNQRLQIAQLRALVHEDALTGLRNRRAYETILEQEIARSERFGRPMTLVSLDVDHFKLVNDTHGHDAGDVALRAVALALGRAIRDTDYAARPGGEEFAIILPECTVESAREVVQRVLDAVRTGTGVTVSAGIATYPDHGATSHDLILKADVALYRAKAEGRDRLCVAV